MPYPFVQWPTLDEFIKAVSAKYQVKAKPLTSSLPTRYLARRVGGRARVAYLPPGLSGRDRLGPTQLRSLCSRLEIPLDDFGLTMG